MNLRLLKLCHGPVDELCVQLLPFPQLFVTTVEGRKKNCVYNSCYLSLGYKTEKGGSERLLGKGKLTGKHINTYSEVGEWWKIRVFTKLVFK